MINLLLLLLLNSLVCFGFWNACLYEKTHKTYSDEKGFTQHYNKGVLWRLEQWAVNKWFYKPLCGCLPCMASFHSIYVYWLFNAFTLNNLLIYPIYILALSGLNYLIDRI